MNKNVEVYNIICQPGPARVITVAPLHLGTAEIPRVTQEHKPEGHESNPRIKLKSQKEHVKTKLQITYIKPLPNYVTIPDTVVPPRAYAVIPRVLQCRSDKIIPRRPLREHARFGPVQGVMKIVSSIEVEQLVQLNANDMTPVYFIKTKEGGTIHIDVSDHDKSNWISLLPLGTQETANVWLCQQEDNLYAVSTKSIASREPLKIGYTREYAIAHKIPESQPVCNLNEEFNAPGRTQFCCIKCSVVMSSLEELEQHKIAYHNEKVPNAKFRCKYCFMIFTRRFSLKRHVSLNCTKTKSKEESLPDNIIENPVPVESIDNFNQSNPTEDEPRLPSDESLQNFSSILDFSTNLFDTDRISNLDISACTRPDNDFNLINDFDFDEALVDSIDTPEKGKINVSQSISLSFPSGKQTNSKSLKKTSSPYSCTFCKQIVPRNKARQHAKACLQRRFHCQMCRRFFRSKKTLAVHVFNVHKESESTENQNIKSDDIMAYKCSHCQLAFKRRGMLVNHMSRSHGATAARLPLLVRDRRYPCPRCPKLYSAAAKRDNHVAAHHPGIVYNRSHTIELGQRVKQASSCWLCPRQYATKAKLRQHIRNRHPGAAEEQEGA